MSFLRKAWETKDSALWLALIRILIGYEWLRAGWEKVTDPEFAAGLSGTLVFFAKDNPNGWYVGFLQKVAMPNVTIFATLVAWGELLVGLALVLGLLTEVAAFFGMVMNGNYFFAASHLSPSTYGLNLVMFVVTLVLLLTRAGKSLGLDQLWYNRGGRWFPWLPPRVGEG